MGGRKFSFFVFKHFVICYIQVLRNFEGNFKKLSNNHLIVTEGLHVRPETDCSVCPLSHLNEVLIVKLTEIYSIAINIHQLPFNIILCLNVEKEEIMEQTESFVAK